ncbi:hypothetical protein ANN_01061 [Periplaneta americana]|uniref:DDE-1 domain-containing protein n=1 Tax=Periplaneta americana TaxID=6978 RepID=A0ABQ8TVF7_PERAM|nr:hypothetical protein ANN_01061 [Periplaneta americana]
MKKRKLFVTGKSKNPRRFKHVKILLAHYNTNRKSWMTSNLFETELRCWNKELRTQKRKILLHVDNCPAHPELEGLESIKLVFFPANTTSLLQPMDQREYATTDDDTVTTDDDIVREVKNAEKEEDKEEENDEISEVSIPTVSEVLDAIRVVN